MRLHEFTDVVEFQQRAAGFLEAHEAENNLMLGIMGRLANGGSVETGRSEELFLCTLEEDQQVVAAAIRTSPYRLILSRSPAVGIAILADYLARKRMVLPGIVGPTESADLFARAWNKLSLQRIHPGRGMRIYQLEKVTAPSAVPGHMGRASMAEFDLLVDWAGAFTREINETTPINDRRLIETALAEHRLFVWRDPHPVCLAAWAGPTAHGVRINMVYTPPAFRNRGYASATVAALSQRLLESGRRFCFLFADLANPTSNSIYRRIGYQPVCAFAEYHFENR